MHSFVTSLRVCGLSMLAGFSGVWLLASSAPLQAGPALRGTTVQEPEIATVAEVEPGGATGGVAGEIYSDWSRRRLEAEKTQHVVPHPLARSHPDHFVVVCEAGCSAGHSGVVNLTLRHSEGPSPAHSANTPGPITNASVCVGGCYNDAGPEAATDEGHSEPGLVNWMTTPEPGMKEPVTQTYRRWHDRIGNPEIR